MFVLGRQQVLLDHTGTEHVQWGVDSPGRFVQLRRGNRSLSPDGFHLVYGRHKGRVAVSIAVLFAGCRPRRCAEGRDRKSIAQGGACRVFV